MKILVIGASGMIGSTVLRVMSEKNDWDVFGTVRHANVKRFFAVEIAERLVAGVDVEYPDTLMKVLDQIRPDVVINCTGLTKHKPEADDPLISIPINTLMPHRLAGLCKLVGARLVHISTDCVFSGEKGRYTEDDFADARDVYGKSKVLGEVLYPHAITLRTSTIGHELQSQYGLLDWFLSQEGRCKGYTRRFFRIADGDFRASHSRCGDSTSRVVRLVSRRREANQQIRSAKDDCRCVWQNHRDRPRR
jgi:dTDP-4-dehydrorhamnose reductase